MNPEIGVPVVLTAYAGGRVCTVGYPSNGATMVDQGRTMRSDEMGWVMYGC